MSVIDVELWICLHCGTYYGSSSAGDLTQKRNYEPVDKHTRTTDPAHRVVTGTRDQCSECRQPRKRVQVQVAA